MIRWDWTRAQVEQDPRQATPRRSSSTHARPFTRSSSVPRSRTFERRFPDRGHRLRRQPLGRAVPRDSARQPGAADELGGVVQLDRDYAGAALRLSTVVSNWRFSVGAEYDLMDERRRGFVNNLGCKGRSSATKTMRSRRPTCTRRPSGSLPSAGARTRACARAGSSSVPTITSSREIRRQRYTQVLRDYAGRRYALPAYRNLSFYGTFGEGFETPTFAELAHQNPPATGLNSRSKHRAAGMSSA